MKKRRRSSYRLSQGDIVAGRYRITYLVGAGNVGTVVRASDDQLDHEIVALKILHPHLSADAAALARFENEVLLTRQLAHPNIVRVYDFDKVDQEHLYFIAMECIDGPNLRQFLDIHKAKRLPLSDVVRIIYQLANALLFAHEKKVVHRDIKPENVMLSSHGEVKLGDFGLSKCFQSATGLTTTGEVIGTPLYMAPELFRGENACPRSDIYSLGILAYEMAAGALPFNDENLFSIAEKHLTQAVPIAALREANMPAWFLELVQRCTAKERSERLASCREINEFMRSRTAETLVEPRIVVNGLQRLTHPGQFTPPPSFVIGWRLLAGLLPLILIALVAINPKNSFGRRHLLQNIYRLELGYQTELPLLRAAAGLTAISALSPDALYGAIAAGDNHTLEVLLDLNLLPASTDGGESLLHFASRKNAVHSLARLVRAGAKVDSQNKDGETPLHIAIKMKHPDTVDHLLLATANPNIPDTEGNTALHLAVEVRSVQLIAALMTMSRVRTSDWVRNKNGDTALHCAVRNGDVDAVDTLLLYGADANDSDIQGRTPLMLAFELHREKAEAFAEVLLRYGADAALLDKYGRSARDYAAEIGAEAVLRLGSES